MSILRLILLLVVLGGLTLLLVQNWSPVLPLVFLGMQTQSLPLAMWILFSTMAGAITTVFITFLLNLSNYFVGQQRQTPRRSPATSPRRNQAPREEPTSRPFNPKPPEPRDTTEQRTEDTFDDWERGSRLYDDWEFAQQKEEPIPNPQNTEFRDSKTYDRPSEPKKSTKSDSVYSYSSSEPKNTGVGKTESIYDADYRVIIPPYEPPKTKPTQEEDWGFLDEDDFKDGDQRPR
ncbi:MAG: LapA family protein [Scytonema sp. PMC 1069.18]|nr:LapA family protein [Scytonema sp. PMC 1069.18]MEC4883117.1 LapA family protein [Scytonema sp. PMC 1070.18]